MYIYFYTKKDENVHRFALNELRGELLESEKERVHSKDYTQVTHYPEREREREV